MDVVFAFFNIVLDTREFQFSSRSFQTEFHGMVGQN